MMPPGPAGGWDTFIIIGDAGYHMADINFCTRCGENVSPEALYCPACGTPIEGRVAADGRTAEQVIEDRLAESRVSWILMLLIIYAIPAIVAGLYLIIEKDAVASIMMAEQSFVEFMTQYGMSESQLRTYVGYIGILALVSGLSAAVLDHRRHRLRGGIVPVHGLDLRVPHRTDGHLDDHHVQATVQRPAACVPVSPAH